MVQLLLSFLIYLQMQRLFKKKKSLYETLKETVATLGTTYLQTTEEHRHR